MSGNGHLSAAQIRSSLDHPVIDGDGHWVEFDSVFSERMRKVGGDRAADGFMAALKTTQDALGMSLAERRRRRLAQPGFWTRQAGNTLDRATAMMPRLLYDRLDELGIDFGIIYPTAGLRLPRIKDDATRRAVIDRWLAINAEDIGIVRRLQRGRASPAFAGGVFARHWERPVEALHALVGERMGTSHHQP